MSRAERSTQSAIYEVDPCNKLLACAASRSIQITKMLMLYQSHGVLGFWGK